MPWVKDAVSLKPRIVYTASADLSPIVRVIYDPRPAASAKPWVIEYAWLNTPQSTLAVIESLMGL